MYADVSYTTAAPKIYGYSILIGIGAGMFAQASFSIAQATVKPEEIPQAVGYVVQGQVTGITIAISVANSLFLNEAEKGIAKVLPNLPREPIQASIAGVGSKFVKSLPLDLQDQVLQAIVRGLNKTYILIIAAGAFTVVASVFLKRERLFMAPGGGI